MESATPAVDAPLASALLSALGPDLCRAGADIGQRHFGDWAVRAGPDQAPLALVLPRRTEDVAAALALCHRLGIPVVAQGGLTGLTGGATPVAGAVLISLERMNGIAEIDAIASTMTVEAGATLQCVQDAAEAAGLFFPLDIGGRGSCQIGGNIGTNAGGNRVLRYGMMRDLVLGLEAVLPDGTVMTSLNKMLKNNAGYDLKHLFIGSEGTLGIVTRAVLRLFPKPAGVETALLAFATFDHVYAFLRRAREQLAGSLSAFETMWPEFYERAIAAIGVAAPLAFGHAAYVLIEAGGTDPERDASHFQHVVEAAIEEGIVADGVIAGPIAHTSRLWAIRDASGVLVQQLQPLGNFDVSVETGRIDAFRGECLRRLRAHSPTAEVICFGHLADSNLHMFVTTRERPFPLHAIEETVYGCVRDWSGSISAEHGIGLLKRPYLGHSRAAAEIALMMTLKRALDPKNILNPGKVMPFS